MYYASEQPALKPSSSQNPISASEPWNLVIDAQTLFGTLRAIKPDLPQPQRSVTKAFTTRSTGEFWDFMVKGCAPIQMMTKGPDEELRCTCAG